jgi:hypothetical protein
MSSYKQSQWQVFRDCVIELDGYKCRQCGRGKDEVVLQVHHKEYKVGLKAWEYPTSDCITLCQGCHAQIHGIIQPSFGWQYVGDEDLGDLVGTCENRGCGADIRYSFTVYHPQWGTLEVGTVCCDNLTDSQIASNLKESKLKFESRKHRFINSKRWRFEGQLYRIEQGPFDIEIIEEENEYSLRINGKKSKKIKHKTLIDAKTKVFEVIEDGQLMKFFKENNFEFGSRNKEKKSNR